MKASIIIAGIVAALLVTLRASDSLDISPRVIVLATVAASVIADVAESFLIKKKPEVAKEAQASK